MACGVDWEAYLVSFFFFLRNSQISFNLHLSARKSMQSISVLSNDHRSSVALACAGLYLRLFKLLAVDKKFLLA